MWSDTPNTAVGLFCFGWCTDVGIDRLNKLLDDPANDSRPYEVFPQKRVPINEKTTLSQN
jgi:hypothetical protein